MERLRPLCLTCLLFLGVASGRAQFRVTPVRPVSPAAAGRPSQAAYPRQSGSLLHELANLQADYRLLREELERLVYRVKELEAGQKRLLERNKELQALVTAMDVQAIQRQKEWDERIAGLQAAIRQESSRRSEAMRKMSSNVVDLISDQQKAAAVSPPAAPASGKWVELRIEPGDTLGRIAKSAGITVKQLMELNQLKSDRILVGQVLRVPVP